MRFLRAVLSAVRYGRRLGDFHRVVGPESPAPDNDAGRIRDDTRGNVRFRREIATNATDAF